MADLALLRGRTGDPALGPGGVRESDAFEAVTLRKRVAWVRELLPFAGVGLVRWDRHGCLSLTGAAPRSAGVSNRRCSGLTTRGVRADRVGVTPVSTAPARAPARQGGVGCESGRRPLTRETSTSDVYGVRVGLRTRTVRRDGAARGARRDSDPCAAKRGSGDRVVVLAGCCGCRSRRAALGPGREAMGLALWHARASVRARWVNARWKPVRGGESHEHASSETGGGLLVIPRA